MTYSLIEQLSESKLFPSKLSLDKHEPKEIAEWTLLNLCALRVLLADEDTSTFARNYARKTARWGEFKQWRSDGSDLYVLLHALQIDHEGKASSYHLNYSNVVSWLRDASLDKTRETTTRRLFLKLDLDLKVKNETLKSIRRIVMDWEKSDDDKRKTAVTRTLQLFRSKMKKSELLQHLERTADRHGYEVKGTHTPEADDLHENATAGSTGAASVATVVGGLGAGFDPEGDWGIYPKPKAKKEAKPVVLRRPSIAEAIKIKLGSGARDENSPASKFIDEVEGMTHDHPFDHHARIYGNAVIHISRSIDDPNNGVHIHDIVSLEPGHGHGSTVLAALCKLADELGVTLDLTAMAYAKNRLSTKDLMGWYSRYGFRRVGGSLRDGVDMVRKPQG